MRFPRPERPFWNLLQKACYTFTFYVSHTFLNAGYWLAASCCTAAVALTATDAAGTLEKNSITAAAAAGAADPSKGGFRQGNPMLLRGDNDCCCCAHKGTALPDGETPWPWRTNRVQNMRFPRPERPFWNLLQIASWWLAASCCTAAVALTAAASACVCCCLLMPAAACCCLLLPAAACCLLLVLLLVAAAAAVVLLSCCCNQTASKARNNCCCCCCAHKDTALPDGETPWPWRTNGVQNIRFPRPERPFWNLLQKACYTFLDAGYWLAASCCTAAVANVSRCWLLARC